VPEVGPAGSASDNRRLGARPFSPHRVRSGSVPGQRQSNTHRGYRCRSRARTVARQQCSAVRVVLDQILAAQRLMIATGYLPGQIGVAVAGMQQ